MIYLDLSGNKLTGRIPATLGKLKDSIETLRINNTGMEGCIPDELKYVQSSSTDIPQVNLSLDFCSEYIPPPTPTATPMPTSTPLPGNPTVPPGTTRQPTPTPKPTTPIGQPTVNFHASQTEVLVGEPVVLTLSVANSIIKSEMTLQLVLQLPSGLLVSGEGGIGEECSVQCVGIYTVPTGENKDFLLTAVANQPGSFDIEGRMEWFFGGDPETTHDGDAEKLRLNVLEPQLPPTPTPTPTATPEPTDPAAACRTADCKSPCHANGSEAGRPGEAATVSSELHRQAGDDVEANSAGPVGLVNERFGIRGVVHRAVHRHL